MNINLFKVVHIFVTVLCLSFNDAISTPPLFLNLQERYEYYCNTSSDIDEDMSLLRILANECSSVTEIGVRSIVPTWNILQGLSENSFQGKSYLGINLENPSIEHLQLVKQLAEENEINFTFWHINDMEIELEPIDMLFIDSLDTYSHLTYELEIFSPKVRKYICIHAASDPWPTVESFLQRYPEWSSAECHNNHGFTILQRNDLKLVEEPVYHADVDYFLKNKIILCTGPSLGRYEMLKNITEEDLKFIPFKKIFVTTNDPLIMNITFNEEKPDFCELIDNRGQQMDCLNCIITTIKNAVNDPEVLDDDIILFKHESVFINDIDLIKKSLSKILSGEYNMVGRIVDMLGGMGATDAFFVKVSAIRKIINELSPITHFPPHAWYCESYFTQYILNQVKNVYKIHYYHSNAGFTELGFYHLPSVNQMYIPRWDRKNRNQLFKDF